MLRERDYVLGFPRDVIGPGETAYLRLRSPVALRARRLVVAPGRYVGLVEICGLSVDGSEILHLHGPVSALAFVPSQVGPDVAAGVSLSSSFSGHCLPGSEVVLCARNTSRRRVAVRVALLAYVLEGGSGSDCGGSNSSETPRRRRHLSLVR
jgi:hypothetical protein